MKQTYSKRFGKKKKLFHQKIFAANILINTITNEIEKNCFFQLNLNLQLKYLMHSYIGLYIYQIFFFTNFYHILELFF